MTLYRQTILCIQSDKYFFHYNVKMTTFIKQHAQHNFVLFECQINDGSSLQKMHNTKSIIFHEVNIYDEEKVS